MAVLLNSRDFRVFLYGYRGQNENAEFTENLYFKVYNAQIHVDLFFDPYFSWLGVKTDIDKKRAQFAISIVVKSF